MKNKIGFLLGFFGVILLAIILTAFVIEKITRPELIYPVTVPPVKANELIFMNQSK